MKKYFAAAAVVTLAAMPVLANAAQFRAGQEYSSGLQDRVSESLYVAAGTVAVGAPVAGDLWVAGGDISVTGPVSGDAAIGGGTVQLLSAVQGDVRAVGGKISINSTIGGDLLVAGGSVHILSQGVVEGGLYVAGGQVTIDGTVRGPVRVRGGRLVINGVVLGSVDARLDDALSIGPAAQIDGAVNYRAPHEAVVPASARVGGAIIYASVPQRMPARGDGAPKALILVFLGVVTAMRTLALVGLGLLLVWRWRRQTLEILQDAHDRFFPSMGRGLLYGILIPVAAVLLLVSFVGTLAGALLFMVYGALVILAKVMSGLLLGAWAAKALKKGSVLHLAWAPSLAGIVALELLGLVPVVGWILRAALCLAIFGALATRTQRALA